MLKYWIWLAERPNVSARQKLELLQHFETPAGVYSASEKELAEFPGLSPGAKESLEDHSIAGAEETEAYCLAKNIGLLRYDDPAYPQRLKNIYDPPILLYYKGTLPDFDSLPVIAMVGTRKASAYGLNIARRYGYEIGKCGGLVVSGLADGADAAAMRGALLAGAPVVGVLGCGIDIIYPRSNRDLYRDTERYGCILSEYCPGTKPVGWNFPKRNRIISGLSCGVVVTEAPEKSGALITAREANDQGRDIYVVPGNVDIPTYVGSNQLLRDGASPALSGWDVLREYEARFPDKIHRDDTPVPANIPVHAYEEPEEIRDKTKAQALQSRENGIKNREKKKKQLTTSALRRILT